MGKRKSSKKPMTRTKETLSTSFKCLFCHHEKSVTVKIDKQAMFGHLNCKICGQKFTTPINNLSAAVDVYCDWVDACEDAQKKQPAKKVKAPRQPSPAQAASAALGDDDDEEDDDDLDLGRHLDKPKRKTSRDYEDDSDDDRGRHRKHARRAYDDDDDEEDDE